MLIAASAIILCIFFGLLFVLIIFLSFSGLSQTPDPFLNPTTQSKSSFSAVETILYPTAVIQLETWDVFFFGWSLCLQWPFWNLVNFLFSVQHMTQHGPKNAKNRNVSPFLPQIRYTLCCTNVIRGWMCVKARQRPCTKNIGNEFTFKRSHLLW